VLFLDKGVCLQSPPVTIVGPQTNRRVDMQLRGKQSSFVIMFQPDGLRRLFSLPMQELADRAGVAHSLIGARISQVWQQLGNLASFEKRVLLVNEFLVREALRSVAANGISKAVTFLSVQAAAVM